VVKKFFFNSYMIEFKLNCINNKGLVAAFIGCLAEEYEGKIYVYGATNDDKYQEISNKLQQIGCSKCNPF
jgi:hypothetical protein